MFTHRRYLGAIGVLLFVWAHQSIVRAATITVLCSNGLRAVLSDVAPQFEHATGNHLTILYSVSSELTKRIAAGELVDVAVLTPSSVDQLIAGGKLVANTRATVARSGIGIAVRRGARKPDLRTVDALKTALISSTSIAFAKEGAGGLYFTALVSRLGLAEQLTPRFRPTVTGEEVNRAVASGEAELGVQPISEILSAPGVDLAGSFPAAVQDYAVMVAAVGSTSPRAADGRALIAFLMSSAVDPVVVARGMERVPGDVGR